LNFDTFFKDLVLFYECFHGDNGRGIGASHQTGWTGVIAEVIRKEDALEIYLNTLNGLDKRITLVGD